LNDRVWLLDTHIILWLDSGDPILSQDIRDQIDDHWRAGGLVAVSAVSAWEIALLAEGGRIVLDVDPAEWMERFVSRPGFEAIPLSLNAAANACALDWFANRDPADRMLVATAIELGCVLVTVDQRIRDFAASKGGAGRLKVC
jgi:PIN domain nuclease of toxin-antitoxin system